MWKPWKSEAAGINPYNEFIENFIHRLNQSLSKEELEDFSTQLSLARDIELKSKNGRNYSLASLLGENWEKIRPIYLEATGVSARKRVPLLDLEHENSNPALESLSIALANLMRTKYDAR